MSLLNILSAVGHGYLGAEKQKRVDTEDAQRAELYNEQVQTYKGRRKAFADALHGMQPTDADPTPTDPTVPAGTGAPVSDPGASSPAPQTSGSISQDDLDNPPDVAGQLARLGGDMGTPSQPDTDPDTGKPTTPTAVGVPTASPAPTSAQPPGIGTAKRGRTDQLLASLPKDPLGAGDDPEVLYNAALKSREDEDRNANTQIRLGTLQESRADRQERLADQERQTTLRNTEAAASNKQAYADAQRIGAPAAQGPYSPDTKYADVYTRYQSERSANRGDATGQLAAGAASRSADTAERTRAKQENDTRARGALLMAQLPRLPSSDQTVLQQTVQTLKTQNPKLDDNMAWGLAGEQYEKMQADVQNKPRLKALPPTPGPGQVSVTDPALQAEILRQRQAAGGGTP